VLSGALSGGGVAKFLLKTTAFSSASLQSSHINQSEACFHVDCNRILISIHTDDKFARAAAVANSGNHAAEESVAADRGKRTIL